MIAWLTHRSFNNFDAYVVGPIGSLIAHSGHPWWGFGAFLIGFLISLALEGA
jgi:hypothetical protein